MNPEESSFFYTVVHEKDCYDTSWSYRGKANTTVSGIPCRHWNVHHHLGFEENYCRNSLYHCVYGKTSPWNIGDCFIRNKPWCYTTDPDVLWEYCAVEKCETGM